VDIFKQNDFWEPPLAPCLESMGLTQYGDAGCEDARNLGNAMGAEYDASTDCNRTATSMSFSGRGDLLYSEMGCDADPNGRGSYEEL